MTMVPNYEKVLGNNSWRFVSPRKRAGEGHLKDFDVNNLPEVIDLYQRSGSRLL